MLFELSQQQSSLSGEQEVWQLPGGLTWSETNRVVLRYISWLALHDIIISCVLNPGSLRRHRLGG